MGWLWNFSRHDLPRFVHQHAQPSRLLVEILLEARERPADLFRLAEVGQRVGDGVVVSEPEQRRELPLLQFLDAHGDVMLEDEIEERPLLGVEGGVDVDPRMVGALFARRMDPKHVRAAIIAISVGVTAVFFVRG